MDVEQIADLYIGLGEARANRLISAAMRVLHTDIRTLTDSHRPDPEVALRASDLAGTLGLTGLSRRPRGGASRPVAGYACDPGHPAPDAGDRPAHTGHREGA
ncbi:hypothetical protein C8N32_10748 [Rhodovulum imhoffii]|uniref:Uncharacterized protein n=2 Tax=Rhodovulum imhoffii TaxID=365340 RepID=A0A2T5BSG2_9RHOB|nr:hypothetical protein [Rhodovulum imhoffii]PTN02282.1 hypothetical protein C8N32_10748 [Rhodovulum imhoffii]